MLSRSRIQSPGFPKPQERVRLRDLPPPPPSTVKPIAKGSYSGSTVLPTAAGKGKPQAKVRHDIRQSAKGEECTVRIPGVCTYTPETVVWSHYPLDDAGKGMATKSLDLVGCYCCAACHDVVDGRVPRPVGMTPEAVLLDWFKGHARSLVRLAEKGLL